MSQRHRASLGGFSYAQGKTSTERDNNNARSFSASRQTIIGYKPNNPNNRSSSAGRESLLGSRSEAKSLAPGQFVKPKKKVETKVYLEKKDLNVLINNIFEFLSTHGYENAISKKGLSNGNKNIFLSMLSFLLRLLDPCFNVDLNLVTEDDVLRLLKLVGYSYSFSKNFFAAIGAPNNWTHCLHILNWIIELIKYFEETNPKDKAPKEIVDKSDNELLTDFVQKKFLQNPDSMDIQGPTELSDKLTRRHDYLQVLLKDYELKIENIKLVLQNTLHDFPDPNELSIKICQLRDEVFNIEQLIAKARNENADLTSSNQNLKRTIDNLEHDIQLLSKDKQEISTLIQNQPFNVEESERFMKEINKSETNKSKLLQTKNEKVNKKYRLIQGLEDIINELEMRAQAFNNTIQSERDIFTKCSSFLITFDHSIVTDVRVDDPCYTSDQNYLKKLCAIDPKKEVKPTLREIIESNSKNIKQMEDQSTNEKFTYQQLEDEIQELNAKIEEHNFKLKRVLEAYEDKVEILNRENSTFSETRQKLQREIDELREKLGESERMKINVTTALNNIMNNFDKCSSEYSENQKNLKDLLNSDFNLALAHKKEIINNIREIDSKFGKIKESFEEYLE